MKITWLGDGKPNLPGDTEVRVFLRGGSSNKGPVSSWDWGRESNFAEADVVAYEVIDKPMAPSIPRDLHKFKPYDCKPVTVGEMVEVPKDFDFKTQLIPTTGIGDVTSTAKGSGARYNTGKPDFSLLPLWTLVDEVKVWMYGMKKYAAWNWTKGMAWSVPFACMMRHMMAWQTGEENDPESGLPHLDHAMCNLRMLKLYSKNYTEGDDRPKSAAPQEVTA